MKCPAPSLRASQAQPSSESARFADPRREGVLVIENRCKRTVEGFQWKGRSAIDPPQRFGDTFRPAPIAPQRVCEFGYCHPDRRLLQEVGGEVFNRHVALKQVQNSRLFRRADGRTESFKSFYETGETLSA